MLGTMSHIILIYAIIIGIIWLAAFLKDLFVYFRGHWDEDRQHKRIRGIFWLIKHEPMMNNFTNRFFYEIFFEACLCSMISVANNAYNEDLKGTMGFLGYLRALKDGPILILIGCGIFTIYVLGHYWTSLFKYFRNDKIPIFLK